MAVPNPIYIDKAALHQASVIRLMAYAAVTGQEGVLGNEHLAVRALDTPAAKVQALPGGYSVLARHLGGDYEAYVGKIDVAETTATIGKTGSGGGRSDLVILRIENPYVSGSGPWTVPADAVYGPYAYVRVIEGVSDDVWDVAQYNATWSAITLARIDRGANTNVVTQDDITDLRSIAQLGGTRTVVIENPPAQPPPIAQSFYMEANASRGDDNYPNSDGTHDYWIANTSWQDWPAAAVFQVPVPEWAREMDIDCQILNAQILFGDVYGELSVNVDGDRLASETIAVDYGDQPGRHILPFAGTFSVDSGVRGKVVTFKTQMRSYYSFGDNSGHRFDAKAGTVTRLSVNFQRYPS